MIDIEQIIASMNMLSPRNPLAPMAQSAINNYGKRSDGSMKGLGYYGEIKRPDGQVSTELSVGVNLDGKEIEIPVLVPGLTQQEINYLISGKKPTPEILNKAVGHARKRLQENKSPFAQQGEQIYTPIK